MRMLKFSVEGQQLAKSGDFTGVTAGSKGYLRCRFEQSDPEWLMAKKIAVFNDEYAVTVSAEGECAVPDEVTDGKSFKVYLAGQNGKTRMITNKVLIERGQTAGMAKKLDIFYAANKLTDEQYAELTEMLTEKTSA